MRKDMYGGVCLHLTPLPVSSPLHLQQQYYEQPLLVTPPKLLLNSSITLCGYSRETTFSRPSLFASKSTVLQSFSWAHHHRKRTHLTATRNESPYDVLGVSPSATPQEIKRAYRKLALKYHPDVNKEANAEKKFMRIKHAYNILLNSESQQKYDFRNSKSNNPSSTSERSRSWKAQEEEFYGFGNFLRDVQITIDEFFRDLQVEFQNWEASAGSQEKPKSLWEELADVGEELVEFLEKELNITDANSEVENSSAEETSQSVQTEASKTSTIEDNIDEIESALEQLKRELGL